MDTTEAVKQIQRWALENYENGGDTIVECFSEGEIIAEFITDEGMAAIFDRAPEPATTVEEALRRAQEFCTTRHEYAEDIRASGR